MPGSQARECVCVVLVNPAPPCAARQLSSRVKCPRGCESLAARYGMEQTAYSQPPLPAYSPSLLFGPHPLHSFSMRLDVWHGPHTSPAVQQCLPPLQPATRWLCLTLTMVINRSNLPEIARILKQLCVGVGLGCALGGVVLRQLETSLMGLMQTNLEMAAQSTLIHSYGRAAVFSLRPNSPSIPSGSPRTRNLSRRI